MLEVLVCGALFAAGSVLAVRSKAASRWQPRRREPDAAAEAWRGGKPDAAALSGRGAAAGGPTKQRVSPVKVVQALGAAGGLALGWTATGLLGMAMLLAGLGLLLPPFMAAPARRRRQTREALAWALWSRQLAELARAGSGLLDSIKGSVDHAPDEVAPVVQRVAVTADLRGIEAALEELADNGTVWEPEVAAGLQMAATSGGAVADPLLDLCGRIGDVVDLHRARTEAVVQLWTQTIALLGLAGGVVLLMYRNNPSYFEPYEQGTGQLVFVLIAGILLMSTGFLVYHSVVRQENSVLVPPRRRNRAKEPL